MFQPFQIPKKQAFTLIELLVVIAIIALLLSVILPSLRMAKQAGQSIVCRNNLRTLALANQTYATQWDDWYVPVIDTTMTDQAQPTWNSNIEFREIVGLEDTSSGSSFVMSEEYLCPIDKQADEDYWLQQTGQPYQNYVSYGYNFTDWGPDAKDPAGWVGDIPLSDWSCRYRVNTLRNTANKIMFVDAGDWSVYMSGANYRVYWDRYGQDIVKYRDNNMWYPAYFRHKEGANVAYFDGHVEYEKKDTLFKYNTPESLAGNRERNELIWFCDFSKRKP